MTCGYYEMMNYSFSRMSVYIRKGDTFLKDITFTNQFKSQKVEIEF